jgi:DNA-binding response OmpR family regulator
MSTFREHAAPKTILVIDDHVDVLNTITYALRGAGYTVVTAAHGVEGLNALMQRKGNVSLVIVDLYMPNLGGAHFAELVRIAWPSLPILVISANPHAARDVIQRLSLPVLSKPFGMDALLTVVDKQLA